MSAADDEFGTCMGHIREPETKGPGSAQPESRRPLSFGDTFRLLKAMSAGPFALTVEAWDRGEVQWKVWIANKGRHFYGNSPSELLSAIASATEPMSVDGVDTDLISLKDSSSPDIHVEGVF